MIRPRQNLDRVTASAALAALVISGLAAGAAAPANAATVDVIGVDFSQPTGAVKGGASGMLYGLSDDGVPTDPIIAGASPKNLTQKAPHGAQHPNGDPLEVEDAFFENGGQYLMTNIQDYYPDWAYNGGKRPSDFSTYLDIVRTVVKSVVDESDHPEKYVFTPFNEPDGGNWYSDWNSMKDVYLQDWKAVYQAIKEVYPDAKIAGNGDTGWQPTRTRDFLAFAKANDVLPDLFTWHELGRGSLQYFRQHLAEYRQIESDLGVSPRPVNITEYAMRRDMSVPGSLVQWLAMFEDEKVDAQTAYWTYAGNLNDNMAKTNGANGAWWLLKWYGDLSGQTVSVTPPALNAPDTLQGIGAVDTAKKQATVLFGGTNDATRLDVSGLDPAVFGTTVDIQVRKAEWSGQEGEAQAPPVVVTKRVAVGGTIEIDVPSDNRLDAYQAVITPALPVAPVSDSTWSATIEAENTTLRDVEVYEKDPAADWTFSASGGFDVGSTNQVTSSLTWTVDVPTTGTYRFGAIAGVNGSKIGPGSHALFVDGQQAATIDYEAGFDWGYRGRGETLVSLSQGRHELSVRMSADGTTLLPGSDISLDRFDLTRIDGPETTTYPAVLSRTDAPLDYGKGAAMLSGDKSATFFASARETGYYDVAVRYSTTGAADLGLRLNDRTITGLGADAAGTWTSTARVHLAEGISELRLASSQGAAVQSVTVTRATDGDAAGVQVEAEDSSQITLHGAARLETPGAPTNVSGQHLGWLGGGADNYATLTRPRGLGAGQYDLTVRYANADKNTGHAYNTDVITRFLDISEDGGATTRGAFRNNYSWNGFWTHTVPIDLTTAGGALRLGNTTGNAPNIDWLVLSPLVTKTTNAPDAVRTADATSSRGEGAGKN
ncbi:hypothetical protein [Microbacterium testaceum]|uniref:hypothetical protein n=1 Tax=Microbacterium testaceum TaxID=2033 RepID=UPI002434ED1D|nr:hypothetical protein [Microbacterium testaceum]